MRVFTGDSPPTPTLGLVLLQKGYKGCGMAFPLIWTQSSHWETRMNQGEGELGQLSRVRWLLQPIPLSLDENKPPAVCRLPEVNWAPLE